MFDVVIVAPIMADTEAGPDPSAAKLGMPGTMVVVVQFCACAADAANADTASTSPRYGTFATRATDRRYPTRSYEVVLTADVREHAHMPLPTYLPLRTQHI